MPVWRFVIGICSIVLLFACSSGSKPEQKQPIKPQPPPSPQSQAAATPAGPQPKLELPEKEFHAGTVKQGEIITHTFVLKNRGLGDLNIEKVKGS